MLADRSRVVTTLFVPGQEGFDHEESRSAMVLRRILALTEDEVFTTIAEVNARFDGRHRELTATFLRHAGELADRLGPDLQLSEERRLLLGATFTSEYALEGAAVCNPSIVAHPDQSGTPAGGLRFVMSIRAIGEGHRSSIGFRTGVVDASGIPILDPRSTYASTGGAAPVLLDSAVLREELQRLGGAGETADFVLDPLGDRFTPAAMEERIGEVQSNLATRRYGRETIPLLREVAARSYAVRFAPDIPLDERVLLPAMGAESHGMEDARFVHFTETDGSCCHFATYTAYDGSDIVQQVMRTTDFTTFTSSPLSGPAAANKGLALFPRRIGGRFAALVRSDRESNMVAFSDEVDVWLEATPCQRPSRPWEVVQLGNCGSPIETRAGWLVLTHAVGPMRTYRIGAILLDLDDPTRVLGQLREPLLAPDADEREGYVPNVVYSCGALVHAGTLVLPYGIGDAAIGMATASLSDVLDAMEPAA